MLRLSSACVLAAMSVWTLPMNDAVAADPADATAARPPLRVGPGLPLARPSDAARIARDGDVIEIDAGTYPGDTAIWTQNDLTIRGVGGRAHLRAGDALAEDKAIWVIKGANATVEHIEFSDAAVRYRNGAGIRQEGAGLTVRHCYFHDNENGILSGVNPASDIVIEHSEFARNGHGDGYSHNLYIGRARSLTVRFSYLHRAVVGHNLKSRAQTNDVRYNRIVDYDDGRSSYAIDLPNGGLSYVIGNVLQQGPATENDAIVAYGAEGLDHPRNELYFVNNTVVNGLPEGGRFVLVTGIPEVVRIVNNIFSGPGELLGGPGALENNVRVEPSVFVDPAAGDFRLSEDSPPLPPGIDPGSANGVGLAPAAEYVHPLGQRDRDTSAGIDPGALQLEGARSHQDLSQSSVQRATWLRHSRRENV
jgi:hypothetical protein